MRRKRCQWCGAKFRPRGKGSPQKFCPGGKCRRAFDQGARELGAKVLRYMAGWRQGVARLLGPDPARAVRPETEDKKN
jgi:hypothetical protein